MSVNGITESTSTAYTSYTSSAKETKNAEKSAENTATGTTVADSGVVYEKSNTEKTANAASTGKTQYANPDLVAKLKADAEARTSQLQNIVTQMLSKQGVTFAKANDMWSILASGNFTVDPATKAQAQADIADDGDLLKFLHGKLHVEELIHTDKRCGCIGASSCHAGCHRYVFLKDKMYTLLYGMLLYQFSGRLTDQIGVVYRD